MMCLVSIRLHSLRNVINRIPRRLPNGASHVSPCGNLYQVFPPIDERIDISARSVGSCCHTEFVSARHERVRPFHAIVLAMMVVVTVEITIAMMVTNIIFAKRR